MSPMPDIGLKNHSFQLGYISTAQPDLLPSETREILEISRLNNMREDITGILLFDGAKFFQILEGAEASVRRAFERICEDERHFSVVRILARKVPERDFPDWRMGFYTWRSISGDAGSAFFFAADELRHRLPDRMSPVTSELVLGFAGVDR